MFLDADEEKMTTLLIQAIGAGCALIGMMAEGNYSDAVPGAWNIGDQMAAEFIRRVKEAKKGETNG